MNRIISSLIIVVLMIGCSKEEHNVVSKNTDLLLKRVLKNGEIQFEYSYQNKLIDRTKAYWNGKVYNISNYEYLKDAVNVSDLNYTDKYYFISKDILRRDIFFDTLLLKYNLFDFSGYPCSYTNVKTYDFIEKELHYSEVINLMDGNCSTITKKYNSRGDISSTIETIRDEKNLFNKSVFLKIFKSYNLGNVVRYSHKNLVGIMDSIYSYNATFQYNSLEYPIKETRTFLNDSVDVYTYEYY